MTRIHRYIDDPVSFFFWDVDEVAVFATFMLVGLLTDSLTFLIVLGVILSFILSRVKQSRAEGFFMHILYWYGIFPLKGCPRSYVRDFAE
jgi:conjugal transfer pilus assembly protein TraL